MREGGKMTKYMVSLILIVVSLASTPGYGLDIPWWTPPGTVGFWYNSINQKCLRVSNLFQTIARVGHIDPRTYTQRPEQVVIVTLNRPDDFGVTHYYYFRTAHLCEEVKASVRTPTPPRQAPEASPTVVAYAENQAGGRMMLLDTPCGQEGLVIVSTDAGGLVVRSGCWRAANDGISFITWSDGGTTVPNPANWTLTRIGAALLQDTTIHANPNKW